MNLDNYDLEDHGDGSFTLTPKTDTDEDFTARYKALLVDIATATGYRTRAEARIAELEVKKANARDALIARGIDPDTL